MNKENKSIYNIGRIVSYLIVMFLLFVGGLGFVLREIISENKQLELVTCFILGGMGAIIYCMRGVYINYCALNWDPNWWPWYVLRPFVGSFMGFVSYIFVKAGLPLLGAQPVNDAMSWGLCALAFIAGYNVDSFLKKIENISESAFGIKPSRASSVNQSNKENKNVD